MHRVPCWFLHDPGPFNCWFLHDPDILRLGSLAGLGLLLQKHIDTEVNTTPKMLLALCTIAYVWWTERASHQHKSLLICHNCTQARTKNTQPMNQEKNPELHAHAQQQPHAVCEPTTLPSKATISLPLLHSQQHQTIIKNTCPPHTQKHRIAYTTTKHTHIAQNTQGEFFPGPLKGSRISPPSQGVRV